MFNFYYTKLSIKPESGFTLILTNIFMLALSLLLFYILLNPSLKSYFPIQNLPDSTPIIDNKNNVLLPYPLKNNYILGSSLRLAYITEIKELKKVPSGTEIVTGVEDEKHPPFIIDKYEKTYVQFRKEDTRGVELTPAEASDLKVGQKVRLEMYYEFNKMRWYLSEIYIIKT